MARSRVALTAVLAGMVVLAGCAGGPAAPAGSSAAPAAPAAPASRGTPPGPTAIPDGMGAPEADGVFPRTMTHFGGTTTVPAEPRRVVVIATGQTDAMLTLGVVPVGVAFGDDADLVPRYLQQAYPQYAGALATITSVGARTNPNLESIAALRPDLVLANAAAAQDIYPALSRIAPTVLVEGTGVNWKQDFLMLADSLGREGTAQTWIDRFDADAAALGAAAGDQTVSFVRVTADRTRIFGVASFAGFIAWDAGLARPQAQQFDRTSQDLSGEELRLADGDWIFYSVQGAATPGAAASAPSIASPLWQSLPAVGAGHAVYVDDDPWYLNAGPTAARVVLTGLADSLAP
ncbi:iron-siderophore ABC transporter substrate-binding protein [Pseudonocardia sp. CNS-139]|nr:iron-siderophore ABC transporter substrate-binding protein [Pseudonocardia sp. CNS-139]